MTKFEIAVRNVDNLPEWYWEVIRHETVSDTEITVAEGSEPTSEQALGKAKATLITAMKEAGR